MKGIDRISGVFTPDRKIALMAHAVCGYPDMEASREVMAAMAQAGAAIIEAQLPFSEPSADGPLIIEANHAALRAGATTKACLRMLAALRKETSAPILAMSYLNPIFAYGPEAFTRALVEAGLDGAVVPDLPDDEPDPPPQRLFAEAGVGLVPLIAPSTSLERARELAAASSSPLVYVVLRLGVTGRRTEIDAAARKRLADLHQATGKRVAAGFGIRERSQVEDLAGSADCAVVGSAVLAEIRRALESGRDPAEAARSFVAGLLCRD
ncbi:MAG: tryptophan synthase subunit alpha [Spirochaetota bacterium]